MTEANRGASLVTLVPPTEITFKGPYTDVVTSYLKIQNPQNKTICFKVKTTAPKQYCVRPNSGVLKHGETANISVMLQPIDTIPADAAKHKFMVQSCYAPAEGIDIDAFWKTVSPAELHYGKLRVVFESGAGSTLPSVGAGDSDASFDRASSSPAMRPSPSGGSSAPSGGDDKLRKLEVEVERLQRERTELLLKVQAANAKVAQAGLDYPISNIQFLVTDIATPKVHPDVMNTIIRVARENEEEIKQGKQDQEEETLEATMNTKHLHIAVHDYKAEELDELDMDVDDIIEILTLNSAWSRGKNERTGQIGLYPTNYCEVYKRRASSIPLLPSIMSSSDAMTEEVKKGEVFDNYAMQEYATVNFDYEAKHEDELSLKEGEIVLIVNKRTTDKGWYEGEIDGKRGLFPDNFVTLIPDTNITKPNDKELTVEPIAINDKNVEKVEFESAFFKNFKPMAFLGCGGCGCVFKAQNVVDKMNYAVKRIALRGSEETINESLDEVITLASLRHIGIIGYNSSWIERPPPVWQNRSDSSLLTTFGRTESFNYADDCVFLYMQMELCGQTLKVFLEKSKERDLAEAKVWFKQLVSAVGYLHRKGKMHRDLKPSNILFSEDNCLKIGDLGIVADRAIKNGQEVDRTRTARTGTVMYMAPEQHGDKYSSKVDIYSLGLILTEMCVNMTFSKKDEVFRNYERGRPNTILNRMPQVAQFISKLTNLDAKQRPDCDEILRDNFLSDVEKRKVNSTEKIIEKPESRSPATCVICLDNPPNLVFFDCMHVSVCEECYNAAATNIQTKIYSCPNCRQHIKKAQKVYL